MKNILKKLENIKQHIDSASLNHEDLSVGEAQTWKEEILNNLETCIGEVQKNIKELKIFHCYDPCAQITKVIAAKNKEEAYKIYWKEGEISRPELLSYQEDKCTQIVDITKTDRKIINKETEEIKPLKKVLEEIEQPTVLIKETDEKVLERTAKFKN